MMHGSGERALAQLRKVNGITLRESERLFMVAMAVWRKRSRKKWRVTVEKSLLERYPKLSVLCT
jgi:hypothetical protein